MNAAELMQWWKQVPTGSKKFERLGPLGAVASQLNFNGGDIAKTLAHFRKEEPRISSRYPEFWRGVLAKLRDLEAELEAQTAGAIADELDRECPNGVLTCANAKRPDASDYVECRDCTANSWPYPDPTMGAEA